MRTTIYEGENSIYEIENGILIGIFKKEIVDLEIAEKSVKERLKASEGKSYHLLIDIEKVKNTTKEARKFLASEKGCEGVKSAAILVNSSVGRMIGNFFIFFNKPLVPTRLFTDEKEALVWLRKFMFN